MRNVLHIVEYLYQGGIERLLQQIAKHTPKEVAALSFFSYQTESAQGIAKELERLNVPLYYYNKPKGYDLKLLKQLIHIVKKHQIQTIHTHDFGPMEYAVALKLRFPHLQLVHTHHSLHYFLSIRKYVYFFQLFSLFYDKIICVSEHVRDQLAIHCPLSRKKLLSIYNGVDVGSFEMEETPLNVKLRLVNVSRISPEKNLLHILKACKQLRDAGIDFEFHHAGSGDFRDEKRLWDYVRLHKLEKQIKLHGFQSDIRQVLRLGDIFVSSSLTEGHPVAVLEAMASGKLCLCSNIRPHQLISSESLLFFELSDDSLFQQLVTISKKPQLYSAFRQRARKEVEEKFSLSKMIGLYTALYV